MVFLQCELLNEIQGGFSDCFGSLRTYHTLGREYSIFAGGNLFCVVEDHLVLRMTRCTGGKGFYGFLGFWGVLGFLALHCEFSYAFLGGTDVQMICHIQNSCTHILLQSNELIFCAY